MIISHYQKKKHDIDMDCKKTSTSNYVKIPNGRIFSLMTESMEHMAKTYTHMHSYVCIYCCYGVQHFYE